MRFALALLASLALATGASAADLRFWNLTSGTLTNVQLAPVGTDQFGPNQCLNDRDKEVDYNERLRLTGVEPGRYDVRVTDKKGRTCMARNVEVSGTGRYAFSLSEKELTECQP